MIAQTTTKIVDYVVTRTPVEEKQITVTMSYEEAQALRVLAYTTSGSGLIRNALDAFYKATTGEVKTPAVEKWAGYGNRLMLSHCFTS